MGETATATSSSLVCSVCSMSSENPASFTADRSSCVKCSVVGVLEARVAELEERLRKVEAKKSVSFSEVAAGTSAAPDSARSDSKTSPPADPVQPGQDQGKFVTVRKKKKAKRKHLEHQPLPVQNRFAPLSVTPAEPGDLVIGSSIVRDVRLPAVTVRCFPGARVGDIEGTLRLFKQAGRTFRRIVIHAGGNDARRGQSEVLKFQVKAVCDLAKSMSDTVIYSGPLPNRTNDEMYSRLSSFNRWLSSWCETNDVLFVDNWSAFWSKPWLIRKDGIHPTWDGASFLAQNMAAKLNQN